MSHMNYWLSGPPPKTRMWRRFPILQTCELLVQCLEIGLVLGAQGRKLLIVVLALLVILLDQHLYFILKACHRVGLHFA